MATTTGTQAGFDGFASPVPTDRLFLALFPDADAAARISALAAEQCRLRGLRGTPLRSDRLHVTLFHLGDWAGVPDDLVVAATEAAGSLRESRFELAFDTVASFAVRRPQKPFVLKSASGNQALRGLHARLGQALRCAGLAQWTRASFEPHVTLAYDAQVLPPQPVPPIGWHASEFVLVHSLLGRTVHMPLARWTLAP